MSDLLKQLIKLKITENHEQADEVIHEYLLQKVKQATGLHEEEGTYGDFLEGTIIEWIEKIGPDMFFEHGGLSYEEPFSNIDDPMPKIEGTNVKFAFTVTGTGNENYDLGDRTNYGEVNDGDPTEIRFECELDLPVEIPPRMFTLIKSRHSQISTWADLFKVLDGNPARDEESEAMDDLMEVLDGSTSKMKVKTTVVGTLDLPDHEEEEEEEEEEEDDDGDGDFFGRR